MTVPKNRILLASSAAAGALAATIVLTGVSWGQPVNGRATPATAQPSVVNAPTSFADIIDRVAPAVVSIDVEAKAGPSRASFEGAGPFDAPNDGDNDENAPAGPHRGLQNRGAQNDTPMQATGSGFFISRDGYIVTNNHVVEGADKITVRTKDDRTLTAHLIGRDPATDLAVIKVDGAAYPFVSFEDRAKPRVGDWVVAVGNPFNLGGTATAGIVSALGRQNVSDSSYVDYMQIDAPINRGNSGGPSFDLSGRVVGVNTAIFSPSGGSVGIGFDIPADVASSVTRQLIADGKVTRGYLGAQIQDVTADIAASLGVATHEGALVADLTPGGPAERAGLQTGDLVLKANGHAVTSASDLTRQVGLAHGGEIIKLEVCRDGKVQDISVKSGTRPTEASLSRPDSDATDHGPASAAEKMLGLNVMPSQGGGLAIQDVAQNSDAARKGLQTGDVIVQASGRAVGAVTDLSKAVTDAKSAGRKDVLLLVAHDGHHIFVPVQIGQAKG
jgi:serine protease Do